MAYAYDRELAPWVPVLPAVDLSDPDAAQGHVRGVQFQRPLYAVPDGLRIRDVNVPGPAASPPVVVRLYEPDHRADARPLPAILYFHAGGFVTGDLETGHDECVWTAATLGAVVVNVDYRLAPQHPYPHAVMDAHAVLNWVVGQERALGIDPERIAVVGEDAGAGIAAALSMLTRDRASTRPFFQLLSTPMLDDRLDTESARAYVDTPVLDRIQAAYSWFHYLGAGAGGPEVSPFAAPARAGDLRGLPTTYVAVCEFDPVRDEGVRYAQRLVQAGVTTELHHYPGTFHGCTSIPGTEVTLRMREDRVYALRRALFPSPPPDPRLLPYDLATQGGPP
ncbi:alpha/beta hydrolase [Streptomyces sp. NPDC057011]|uniref:alpha/beta hydrolase n=1 Tax=unclassified Streptomyces TaxID=2593676 RepID=UPI003643571A